MTDFWFGYFTACVAFIAFYIVIGLAHHHCCRPTPKKEPVCDICGGKMDIIYYRFRGAKNCRKCFVEELE